MRHLPDIVAATLTPADVRRILDFQLEFFKRKGVSGNGSSVEPKRPSSSGPAETIEYILERSAATGEAVPPRAGRAVVECQLAYLRFIGAIGRAAGPDENATTRPTRPQAGTQILASGLALAQVSASRLRPVTPKSETEGASHRVFCVQARPVDRYSLRYQRREVVHTMHDQRFGTLEVRGR